MSPSPRALAGASALLTVTTYGLLVFGASVRVHGAGLACPDWPLCFGQVVPEIDFHVALEFGHRCLAGLIGLGFLGVGFGVRLRRAELGRGVIATWWLAAVALAAQIVLGGLTVLELLAQWTVTSHLIVGNTFCMLLLVLTLLQADRLSGRVREPVGFVSRALAVGMALLVPVQLGLGGFVSSGYVGLACPTWPTCDGVSWFPHLGLDPVGLQVSHRLMAYLLSVVAIALAAATRGQGRTHQVALVVLACVAAQATIGIANVLLVLPVEVTLAHTAGAAAVVLSTAWLNFEAWRAPLATARVPALSVEAR